MSTDLHAQLLAAVEARRQLALIAAGRAVGLAGTDWDPAARLRECAEDLDVLQRHHPIEGDSEWCDGDHAFEPRIIDCPELRSLARRYSIDVPDAYAVPTSSKGEASDG
jgi:hypothetical protein